MRSSITRAALVLAASLATAGTAASAAGAATAAPSGPQAPRHQLRAVGEFGSTTYNDNVGYVHVYHGGQP